MPSLLRYSAAAAVCLPFTVVCAADDPLQEVIVTASRIEQPVSQAIGSVTVITRDEIERRQSQSLQDLLRGEAGIDIANNGGLGKPSSIFLRGANAYDTLILVDGVRLGSATTGSTAIELIPVDQIERIEIVRGPRSSLYGSDAIGGVIQIFTRKANGVSASAGAGSHDTQNYTASFGMNNDALRFSVAGNYIQSAGFNACSGDPVTFAGCGVNEPDDDGYRNSSGSAHLGYAFGKAADLELSTLYAQGYTEFDGYFNQARFRQSAPSVRLRVLPMEALTLNLSGGVTEDRLDSFHDSLFLSRYNTQKRNASLQADWTLSAMHSVTLGADYLKDSIDSIVDPTDNTAVYANTSRSSTGVFAQYLGHLGAHEVSAAVRRDDSSQYGAYNTGNLGWKWSIARALSLNAGAGKAFHAPTFNDLYFPYGAGNPNLQPERSRSFELGASGSAAWLTWSVQAFKTTVHDLIALNSAFYPINTEANMRGAELSLRGHWENFYAGVNYTALDPRSREAGSNYNHLLPRRARQSGRIDASYTVNRLQLGGAVNVVGPRYDNLANTVRLGGYTTADFTADLALGAGWSLQGRLSNAFDHQYETARYYNQDGRAVFFTLRYRN